jgi:hypothetical protein
MKSPARISLIILAAFLIFLSSAQTASQKPQTERIEETTSRPVSLAFHKTPDFFNPLSIPELKEPVPIPPKPAEAIDPEEFDADGYYVPTAPDPRYDNVNMPHRQHFIPASELRPPEPGISIPIHDSRPAKRYDMNEWEEQRVFSSNLYTDTSFYSNWINGPTELSSKDEGNFYEENIHYDLYSTKSNGDSLSVILDTTYTNDKRTYKNGFNLNQARLESRTERSKLVLGHAYPQMSRYTVNQNVLGFYGAQDFEYTTVSGFVGYDATDKDDLKDPRYVGGVRLEHSRDKSLTIGLNVVGTEDERDNAGSSSELPTISNKVYSVDLQMRPTENIFIDAEVAQSDTDFDKRDNAGSQKAEAYRFTSGYERENFKVEAGIEQADTAFLTPLGESPRDERAYFARFYYELNQYINARFSQRQARDNLENYQRSTIVRDQPELQVTLKPSTYYKNLRIDFFYQPLHEYSENSNFMDRYRDLLWMEINHQAGAMRYFAGLSQTTDKDDVNVLNDRDIQRFDFCLTWEYDKFREIYSKLSIEKLSYKRAGGQDQTNFYGFGGKSRFNDDISLALDFVREENNPSAANFDSTHDRLNLSLSKEYDHSTRLIIDLEGSDNQFNNSNLNFQDYSARLKYLKAF